jgi:hypothetical protein
MSIRFKIDIFDQQNKDENELDDVDASIEDSRPDTMHTKGPFKSGHIILGAAQRFSSFSEVSAAHSDDPAFSHFKNKFNHFIRTNFNLEFNDNDLHSILDSTTSVCVQILIELICNNSQSTFFVQLLEYRYLKVSFTSKITWQLETNILRCNPKFNNKPRYDHILVANPNGSVLFAQLIFMFTTSNDNRTDPWVLIHPYDTEVGRPTPLERDFQLFRIHAKARGSSRFISANSIIRGVVVVPTYTKDSEYFVFDLLDGDLFMRVRDLWKERLKT